VTVKPVLEMRQVTRTYGAAATLRTDVLKGVDLAVKRGETVAVAGPSGSGKSTLLNIAGTLDRPTSGDVSLDGENVLSMDDAALARLRSSRIGFVFQLHHLLPQCSVLENVLVPTLVSDSNRDEPPEERARRLLDRVGLTDRLHYRPGHLSGGERQRVAVVRALVNRPVLLLADEPTGSLDRAGADNLVQLLVDLNREEGVAIVMVTHSTTLADRMEKTLELRDGRLSAST